MVASSASSLFSVANKNVLITGGSRGIGLMIAQGFVPAGANVYLTSRDERACREAAESILSDRTDSGIGSVIHGPSNVSTREGCKALAGTLRDVFGGKLDVLVNNAGTSWGEDPYDRESGKMNWGWDKVMDLNVKGMFYLTRELVPLLERSNQTGRTNVEDPGRVINIGSVAGLMPQEAPTHAYDVSKAAVHHLTKKMSADLAPRGITVNCLAPGYVPSRMSMGLKAWGAEADKIAESVPLGRMGTADDMAGACIYFSSRAGAWVSGTILNVDGGCVGAMRISLSSL